MEHCMPQGQKQQQRLDTVHMVVGITNAEEETVEDVEKQSFLIQFGKNESKD